VAASGAGLRGPAEARPRAKRAATTLALTSRDGEPEGVLYIGHHRDLALKVAGRPEPGRAAGRFRVASQLPAWISGRGN